MTTSTPHPLLAQVPLTVSPFINLPSSVTLPYTYKSVSPILPPSIIAQDRYILSPSGEHAAHPEDILASCQSLEEHLKKVRRDAEISIREWERSIQQRDFAEKRRVAPGWLDREEKLLQPSNKEEQREEQQQSLLDPLPADRTAYRTPSTMMPPRDEGEELDRAFGGLTVR